MATQNLELAGPIKRTIKGHENWYYGGGEEAYQDRQAALSSVPVPVRIGQTVGIYESGKIVEYWWNELTTDEGLVLKVEAGAGTGNGSTSTSDITEGSNLYYTDARSRNAVSLTTNGTSGASTYDPLTGIFNIPNYTFVETDPLFTASPAYTITSGDITSWKNFVENGGGGSAYTLPIASGTILGGIKVGTGLTIDVTGILSATPFVETDPFFTASPAHNITNADITNWNNLVAQGGSGNTGGYILPIATPTVLGGIKVGTGLTIDGTGILSATPFVETDPLFTASPAYNITSGDISNWNGGTVGSSTTTNLVEGTNLYFTDARARGAISLTTNGNSGLSSYDAATGVFNIPSYSSRFGIEDVTTPQDRNVDLGGFHTLLYNGYLRVIDNVDNGKDIKIGNISNSWGESAGVPGVRIGDNAIIGEKANGSTVIGNAKGNSVEFFLSEGINEPIMKLNNTNGGNVQVGGTVANTSNDNDWKLQLSSYNNKSLYVAGAGFMTSNPTPNQYANVPTAILELESSNQGFLMPRLTTGQRDSLRRISLLRVDDFGSGYTSAPTITITGDGAGATGVPTMGYKVTGFTITNGGSGYNGQVIVGMNGAIFGDTATATVTDGVVTALTISGNMIGATNTNTFTVSGSGVAHTEYDVNNDPITVGGSGLTFTPIYDMVMIGATVTDIGHDYTTATVDVTGGGATLQATVTPIISTFTEATQIYNKNKKTFEHWDGAAFQSYISNAELVNSDTLRFYKGPIDFFDIPLPTGTGGGAASRFGIEDNTSDVDREVAFNRHYLYLQNMSELDLIVRGDPNIKSEHYMSENQNQLFIGNFSDGFQAQVSADFTEGTSRAFLEALSTSDNRRIVVKPTSVDIEWTDFDNNTIRKTQFTKPIVDRWVPLSVNGNFADSTGNITIDLSGTGGGGAATRFGVTGEDDTATQNRSITFGNTHQLQITGTSYTRIGATDGATSSNLDLYTTTGQLSTNSTSGSGSVSTEPSKVNLLTSSNTAQRKLFVKPTGIEFYSYTYASGNDGTIKVPLYEGNNSVYMPLSVNNVRPDATGNITLDLSGAGGGGVSTRFGYDGEDNTANEARVMSMQNNPFRIEGSSNLYLGTSDNIGGNINQNPGGASIAYNAATSDLATSTLTVQANATTYESFATTTNGLTRSGINMNPYYLVFSGFADGTQLKSIEVPRIAGTGANLYMPVSVNGVFADYQGNITISTSGGGTALSLTTTGTSGASTYNSGTGVLNIPNYTYTLPIASASTLGGIKVGSGLSIDGTGVLSSTGLRFGLEDNTATGARAFNTGTNVFTFNGSNTSSVLSINNTGASGTGVTSAGNNIGVRATSSSIGLWATGNNWGIIGESPSTATGIGIAGVSYNDIGAGIKATVVRSTGNNVTNVLELTRSTTGTPSNFIGGAIAFSSDVTGASGYQCGRLIHRVTDVTNTTVSTRFELEVYNAGVPQISFTFKENGTLYVPRTKEFADNAAAKTGGLENGDIYRTGDLLKIVHS